MVYLTSLPKNEALIFSDVRLHIALVLRSKNAHVFRPDLFEEHVEPTVELLEGLAGSKSFAKIRFISEEPLKDHRHLIFLAHAADAIADLAKGKVIYDVVAERHGLLEQGDEVCVIYDLHTVPIPTAPVAEWYTVRGGKIASMQAFFDARPFAAMFEQQQA